MTDSSDFSSRPLLFQPGFSLRRFRLALPSPTNGWLDLTAEGGGCSVHTIRKQVRHLERILACSTTLSIFSPQSDPSKVLVFPNRCKSGYCPHCQIARSASLHDRLRRSIPWVDHSRHLILTSPNCRARDLRPTMQAQRLAVRNLHDYLRAGAARNLPALRRYRNLRWFWRQEVTWSPSSRSYHPHLHCLLDRGADHDVIRDLWFSRFANAAKALDLPAPSACHTWITKAPSLAEISKYICKPSRGLPLRRWMVMVASNSFAHSFGARGFKLAPALSTPSEDPLRFLGSVSSLGPLERNSPFAKFRAQIEEVRACLATPL